MEFSLMSLVVLAALVVFIWFLVNTLIQIRQAVQGIAATLERAFPGPTPNAGQSRGVQ
jgi:hypothetical protein